jgi:polysaccharide biosynthesis protein PslH
MRILFLSTWFPYPPIHGSKIRAYHLLQGLAQRHEVGVLSFADGGIQPEWIAELEKTCKWVKVVKRDPFYHDPAKSILGFLSPRPSAVVSSYSIEMEAAVQKEAAAWRPECVVAQAFVTVPYALKLEGVAHVYDMDNVMAQYLEDAYRKASGVKDRARKWLAWKKFRNYEQQTCRNFELCTVVTQRERRWMIENYGLAGNQVGVVPNGTLIAAPAVEEVKVRSGSLIYNGSLTYQANFEAMDYFLRDIFPTIVAQRPDVSLAITGSTEGVALDRLPQDNRVVFTGFVDNVRDLVAQSCVCVAPILTGGGTRLKILEAMAQGTPVVSTSKGAEGLDVEHEKHLLIADNADEFAHQTLRLLNNADLRQTLVQNARMLVAEQYNWESIQNHFADLVEKA